MTAKCCLNDAGHDAADGDDKDAAAKTQPHDNDSMGLCIQDGGYCDDKSCCNESYSTNLTCCDSEERCDEKCILAAAAFECGKTCGSGAIDIEGTANPKHFQNANVNGHHTVSACSVHLAKAFEQYSAYLESARCICRNILERGWPSVCCGDNLRQSARLDSTLMCEKNEAVDGLPLEPGQTVSVSRRSHGSHSQRPASSPKDQASR